MARQMTHLQRSRGWPEFRYRLPSDLAGKSVPAWWPGESGERIYGLTRLARKSSFQAAVIRRRRWESFPGALRMRLLAMCLIVVKFAGAFSVRTRHSSSRKTISITQWRLFSMVQWPRISRPTALAPRVREVM